MLLEHKNINNINSFYFKYLSEYAHSYYYENKTKFAGTAT